MGKLSIWDVIQNHFKDGVKSWRNVDHSTPIPIIRTIILLIIMINIAVSLFKPTFLVVGVGVYTILMAEWWFTKVIERFKSDD